MRFSRFFLIPLLALLSSASHLQAGTPSDKNGPPQLVTIAPTISPWDVTPSQAMDGCLALMFKWL